MIIGYNFLFHRYTNNFRNNGKEHNGVPIYTIPPLTGFDTLQNSAISDDEHEESRMCCFCETSYFKPTSVIMEKTNNKRLSETACVTAY